MLLTDITFLEEGNPDYIGQLINLTPLVYLWEVVDGIQERYLEYPIFSIPQVQVRLIFLFCFLGVVCFLPFSETQKTKPK